MGYLTNFQWMLIICLGCMLTLFILNIIVTYLIFKSRTKTINSTLAKIEVQLKELVAENELQIHASLKQLKSESELVKYLRDMAQRIEKNNPLEDIL